MLRSTLTGLFALAALTSAAVPSQACSTLVDGPKGRVTEIVDGDTLMLDNGIIVRLIGTQAPKISLGRDTVADWPKGHEARAALAALALGKPAQLRYGGERQDRYGRTLAHVFIASGENSEIWAQQAMLAQGMARVYTFADNRSCVPELLAAEAGARANRLGIWTDPYYSIGQADRPSALLRRVGHYELVEGRVLAANKSSGRVFLNFGRQWKDDFTVVIEAAGLRLFAQAKADPLTLEDALVRVRGWVDDRDGPRIEVTHPEQIEVLAQR